MARTVPLGEGVPSPMLPTPRAGLAARAAFTKAVLTLVEKTLFPTTPHGQTWRQRASGGLAYPGILL